MIRLTRFAEQVSQPQGKGGSDFDCQASGFVNSILDNGLAVINVEARKLKDSPETCQSFRFERDMPDADINDWLCVRYNCVDQAEPEVVSVTPGRCQTTCPGDELSCPDVIRNGLEEDLTFQNLRTDIFEACPPDEAQRRVASLLKKAVDDMEWCCEVEFGGDPSPQDIQECEFRVRRFIIERAEYVIETECGLNQDLDATRAEIAQAVADNRRKLIDGIDVLNDQVEFSLGSVERREEVGIGNIYILAVEACQPDTQWMSLRVLMSPKLEVLRVKKGQVSSATCEETGS